MPFLKYFFVFCFVIMLVPQKISLEWYEIGELQM